MTREGEGPEGNSDSHEHASISLFQNIIVCAIQNIITNFNCTTFALVFCAFVLTISWRLYSQTTTQQYILVFRVNCSSVSSH